MDNKTLGYTVDGFKIDVDYDYEQYWIDDYSHGVKPVSIDVNWNSVVAPAAFLRFKWDDKQLILNRKQLQTIMFLLADDEDEVKYFRGKTQELKRQRHQLKIRADRDIRKGEEYLVNKHFT